MQKKLIVLALATAFAAPAFAATSNVDVYGIASFSVDYVNTHDGSGDAKDFVTGRDNVSRIGFKGSEDLGGGLAAIWQIEMQLNANSDTASTSITTYYGGAYSVVTGVGGSTFRNTFVGLKGGFGTVLLGRHDTPYKLATGSLDPFADSAADYNAIIGRSTSRGASGFFDVRASQTVAYITPDFNGLHAAIAYVEAKVNEGTSGDNLSAWSATAIYNNGPIFGSVAYERHNGGLLGSSSTDPNSAWKLGAGYTFGNAKVGFVYENTNSDADLRDDRAAWYLSGVYTMGNIDLKAAYGQANESENGSNPNDSAKLWAVGLDYNLSKRTKIFGLYAGLNNDNGASYDLISQSATNGKDTDVLSVGIKHSF